MPEELKSPFREERPNPEKELISEEIRAVVGIFEFTRRLRAKSRPSDMDKPRENVSESAGDHTAMTAYLMQYFLPLVDQQEGVKLNYERTLDMVLAHDIGDIGALPSIPGVQKNTEQRQEELANTAKIFGGLPERDGYNRTLFNAYAEYLSQETREARFARALNGLETMLYVLSRPEDLRQELVGGKGYAIEDYRERIEPFCREFPPLQKFYTRIERVFHTNKYFAPSRVYENSVMRPDAAKNIFLSHAPKFTNRKKIDVNLENEKLLQLQRLKRRMRFGQPAKPEAEHNDTVPEHISSLLLLARYFVPATKNDRAQERGETLSLEETIKMILAHDMPEVIRGDKITPLKTEADAVGEWDVATEIAAEYAPRAGGYDEAFWKSFEAYEMDRTRPPFVGNAWLVKGLDVLEAQLYIFDRETRGKLSRMKVLSREKVREKVGKILDMFPILEQHFDALDKKFREEGLP